MNRKSVGFIAIALWEVLARNFKLPLHFENMTGVCMHVPCQQKKEH